MSTWRTIARICVTLRWATEKLADSSCHIDPRSTPQNPRASMIAEGTTTASQAARGVVSSWFRPAHASGAWVSVPFVVGVLTKTILGEIRTFGWAARSDLFGRGRGLLHLHELHVRVDHLVGLSAHHQLALVQPDGLGAHL